MVNILKFRTARHDTLNLATPAEPPSKIESYALMLSSLWFMGGLFLDGWAHNHVPALESFFTPWHAVFYSGYGASLLTLILIIMWRKKKANTSILQSIPFGYRGAVAGAGIFILGGMGDLLWHEIFGIEADIDALTSPTHLLLALGAFLIVGANFVSWMKTPPSLGKPRFISELPMLFSLTSMLSIVTFMTQFSHYITIRSGGLRPEDAIIGDQSINIALTGILLQSIVLTGFLLLYLSQKRVVPFACTFIITLHLLAMGFMRDGLAIVPSGIIAGLMADALSLKLTDPEKGQRALRSLSFLVPSVLLFSYFLTIELRVGLWWSVHLWAGTIVMGGALGLLTSYLIAPPHDGVSR